MLGPVDTLQFEPILLICIPDLHEIDESNLDGGNDGGEGSK